MPEIELSAGVVEYQDTGGEGPVLVFLHGLLMDGAVRSISENIDLGTWHSLGTRAGGEVVSEF